jgi:hypothetical protein
MTGVLRGPRAISVVPHLYAVIKNMRTALNQTMSAFLFSTSEDIYRNEWRNGVECEESRNLYEVVS